MARIRTVAAGGASKTGPTFEDFRRLFLFAHLETRYRGRAWVIVDGDTEGQAVVTGLRAKYVDWPPEHFSTWHQHDFERYYPTRFAAEVQIALSQSGQRKRAAKKQLLEQIKAWCEAEPEEAKAAFEQSAAEVIDRLRHIDQDLFGTTR